MQKCVRLMIVMGLTFVLIIGINTSEAFAGVPQKIANALKNIQETLDNQVIPNLVKDEPRTPISDLPYIIDSSGSYYLTGDLTSMGDGIVVNADNVTIDLMGYSLNGAGSGDTYGIYMNGRTNVEIRNGTIQNFGSDGICEASNDSRGHRITSVRLVSNGGRGINLAVDGFAYLIKDCTVVGNALDGIYAGRGTAVIENVVYDNGRRGIRVQYGCTIIRNTCLRNGTDGIWASNGSTVAYNSARKNGGRGIFVQVCSVLGNISQWNDGIGIYAQNCSLITDNTVEYNGDAGIHVKIDCMVKKNILKNNSGSNVYVEVSGNCIEENLVTNSSNGIYFNSGGNYYANNRASANGTDYANTAGNTDGGGNDSF